VAKWHFEASVVAYIAHLRQECYLNKQNTVT